MTSLEHRSVDDDTVVQCALGSFSSTEHLVPEHSNVYEYVGVSPGQTWYVPLTAAILC